MRRKIWLPLVLVLLLAGCGGGTESRETEAPPRESTAEAAPAAAVMQEQETMEASQVESTARMPTEEEIQADYDRAVRIYSWFDLTPLKDGGETVTADGTEYRRVSEPGIETMEELRLNLRGVFCEELTEWLLSGGTSRIQYREIDGALYVTGEAREREDDKGTVTVEVEQTSDTSFSVNVTVDLLDENEGVVAGMECWAFPYVLENGRWGFSEFRLVY